MNIEHAIEATPRDLRGAARTAVLEFSDALFAIEKKWGELGTDARVLWLDAQTFSLFTPEGLRRALKRVAGVSAWLENWSDFSKKGSPEDDSDWAEIHGAQNASEAALKALYAVVDFAREKVTRSITEDRRWRPVASRRTADGAP